MNNAKTFFAVTFSVVQYFASQYKIIVTGSSAQRSKQNKAPSLFFFLPFCGEKNFLVHPHFAPTKEVLEALPPEKHLDLLIALATNTSWVHTSLAVFGVLVFLSALAVFGWSGAKTESNAVYVVGFSRTLPANSSATDVAAFDAKLTELNVLYDHRRICDITFVVCRCLAFRILNRATDHQVRRDLARGYVAD